MLFGQTSGGAYFKAAVNVLGHCPKPNRTLQNQNCLPNICSRLQPNKMLKNAAAKSACLTTSGATSFFPYAAAAAVMGQSDSVGPSQLGFLQTRCLSAANA